MENIEGEAIESRPVGRRMTAYEREFAALLGEEMQAFSFWKGRVALYAILEALGIGPGDEVAVVGFTCVVVPNAIRYRGARPVYADIAPGSYNLDPAKAAEAITPKTKALIIQHTFGIPAPVEALSRLAAAHDVPMIEDCAHTLGSKVGGQALGTFGRAAFFSSQWSKPYTTGLGGMAVTGDAELALRLGEVQRAYEEPKGLAKGRLYLQYQLYRRFFTPRLYWRAQGALHGLSKLGLFVGSSNAEEIDGVKPADHEWRMAGFQQAIGRDRLSVLAASQDRKRDLSAFYDAALRKAGWPVTARSEETILLRYPVEVSNKEALLQLAHQEQVELGSWFESPLHPAALADHPAFGYSPGQCPVAERTASRVVNLPLHDRMSRQEAERIVDFFLTHAER